MAYSSSGGPATLVQEGCDFKKIVWAKMTPHFWKETSIVHRQYREKRTHCEQECKMNKEKALGVNQTNHDIHLLRESGEVER